MNFVFIIAFFALLGGILAYTITTHYSTSRTVNGSLIMIALIVTIPLLGLSVFALLSSQFDEECRMWALGVCSLCVGFWLKNPVRDFNLQ